MKTKPCCCSSAAAGHAASCAAASAARPALLLTARRPGLAGAASAPAATVGGWRKLQRLARPSCMLAGSLAAPGHGEPLMGSLHGGARRGRRALRALQCGVEAGAARFPHPHQMRCCYAMLPPGLSRPAPSALC